VAAGVLVIGGSAVMQLSTVAGGSLPAELAEPPEPVESPAFGAARANTRGLDLFRSKDYEAALDHFRQATTLAPESAEYHNNLGYTLYRLGDADGAVRTLEEVVRRHPRRQVALANLADAYLLRGDTVRAVETLEMLLAQRPTAGRRSAARWVLERIAPAPVPAPNFVEVISAPSAQVAAGGDAVAVHPGPDEE
jgi:Flp pilus assembly protein TadD